MSEKCAHHWIIEAPTRTTSKGICKYCGEEREFDNSLSTWPLAIVVVDDPEGSRSPRISDDGEGCLIEEIERAL